VYLTTGRGDTMTDKRIRPLVTITLDSDVLDFLTREAKALGMSRSKLIENCLLIAVDDLKLVKKLGVLEVVKLVQKIQYRMKKEVFHATR
jgi:hypothetical protein